ncbi:heavy-metal-associated domain-containing protein [Pedobacter cryoconitis]|uniref:heavy-metal-associated domain-containing protein n=1 Tax=Pedobacter cryoconitis TaxID=188932 RepID=UPI0016158A4C|nr:heavy metal-associated domain-containing protein [Pedobacter cryoconitis]MBB5644522.1 copper chaperone CopZ [Pedobacter cryoconitis]
METLKFKTNIKCGGCVATVTPHLNAMTGLEKWSVDTEVADKVLTVTGDAENLQQEIKETLKNAGFQGELI